MKIKGPPFLFTSVTIKDNTKLRRLNKSPEHKPIVDVHVDVILSAGHV